MDQSFASAMRHALDLTRSGDPAAATRAIQDALGIAAPASPPAAGATIDGTARPVDPRPEPQAERPRPEPRGDGEARPGPRLRLGKVVDLLKSGARRVVPAGGTTAEPDHPPEGRWQRLHFAGRTGARDYRLYVPSHAGAPQGLILLLHGCTQTPEDFAIGTRMIEHAERAGLILVVPEQTRGQNAQLCWNWFRPGDQSGSGGEPALLADLAQQVAREQGVPADRIFAAGLSAGGAMAAILGAERPDVFAAVGVHSGLPAGAARDVAGAFAAMRSGSAGKPIRARTISFHGTADNTVAPANGRAVLDSAGSGKGVTQSGMTGRPWRVTRKSAPDGRSVAEHWEIDGLGHAWSGGDPKGSYADPRGPDASAEMVRFFLG